jgi:hypothetical protein
MASGLNMKMRILLTVFVLILVGCTTPPVGPKFSAVESTSDTAIVYVFRLHTAPYSRKPDITINGIAVAELPTYSYTVLRLKQGTYRIGTDWGLFDGLILNKATTLSVEVGKSYFVHFTGKSGLAGTTFTYGLGVSTGYARDAAPELVNCTFVSSKSFD